MPNIAAALKAEISRLARKEVRAETLNLKKAQLSYRSDIAALKRRTQALEKALRSASRPSKAPAEADAAEGDPSARFSAKGFGSHRRRLGLSAEKCGLLFNVSGQTVYNWEHGKSRPRSNQMAAIAALRKLGKKQASAYIDSVAKQG